MIHYRRDVIRSNKIDCFKPWESKKNESCSPLRNTKQTNLHRVSFADSCNQVRNISSLSSKQKQSMHTVFVNHLRHQLPKLIGDSHTTVTHKHSKDNENLKVKDIYNKTSNRNRNNYRPNKEYTTESDDKTNTINKLYSSSESEITSESTKKSVYRNQSVKNVIEKFNKLSNSSGNNLKQDRFKNRVKTRKEIIFTNDEQNLKEFPCKLRSQRLKSTNKIFQSPKFDDEISKHFYLNTIKNYGRIKPKEFASAETQTTPAPSATNILINVYNQKTPRIINNIEETKKGPVQIKIFENKEDNKINLSIKQEDENFPKKKVEISKKSVRSCIKKFEENLKKNGIILDEDTSDVNIFSKIKSTYLFKQQYETVLSPKAKSVPF